MRKSWKSPERDRSSSLHRLVGDFVSEDGLRKQETPHPIDEDDKITCWIRDHLRWHRPANLPTATPKARAARGTCQNAFPARIAQSVFKLN